jgi:hypothetical protein
MRFLGRVVGSVAAITAVIAVLVAGLIGFGGGLLLVVPVGLVIGGALLFRRSRTMEIGWSGPTAIITSTPGLPLAPAERSAPTRRGRLGVAGSLARVEARELVASPWFQVGIALWLVIVLMFGILFVDDINRSWLEFFGIATLFCHPFAAFAIVAAHRNRSRSRRDHCDEMFDACPADADARTLGHLVTAWVGALVEVCFILLLAGLVAARSSHSYGPLGGYVLAALLACAVIGAGAIALGVTLGRWAPWGLVPFVAVVAVGVASGNINGIGEPAFSTDRMLATLVATTGIDPIFIPTLWWERFAWLAAISVIVAALGLVGGRSTRVATALLGGAALVAIVSAVLIVRPATNDADRIAGLVADPLAHSNCVPAGRTVELCAFEGYEGLAEETAVALGPVVAAVPDGVLRDVMFLTYYEQGLERLPSEVQEALDNRAVQVPDGVLRLRYNAHPENFEAARLRLAARAVGLPTDVGDGEASTMVDGQARGVIVLWLATRGLDARQRDRLVTAGDLIEPASATDRGSIWPGLCYEENAVLQWSPTDLESARVLFALPDDHVDRVLTERWAGLTAPDAKTDDLLAAVGARPLGPPEPIEPQTKTCG